MEATIVKLTQKQLQALDDAMYERLAYECGYCNKEWSEGELELEFDGVIYTFEYYGEYESWQTRRADWYSPAEYDERCHYEIRAAYFYDEDDERIEVETGRENGITF